MTGKDTITRGTKPTTVCVGWGTGADSRGGATGVGGGRGGVRSLLSCCNFLSPGPVVRPSLCARALYVPVSFLD